MSVSDDIPDAILLLIDNYATVTQEYKYTRQDSRYITLKAGRMDRQWTPLLSFKSQQYFYPHQSTVVVFGS